MSDKIKPQRLERKAILYVRQSSTYQVNNNLESQKLQYAMQERLRHLGGGISTLSMTIWADRRRGQSRERVLNGWWPKSVWDR